jgi:hypothetical protein
MYAICSCLIMFGRYDVHWCLNMCGYKMFWLYAMARSHSRFGKKTCCVV